MVSAGLLLLCVSLISQNVNQRNSDVLEYSHYSDTINISVISAGMADSIFDYISDDLDFIEFDDCNNCDARAHIITAIIEKKFILKLAKAWLFADFKRSSQTERYKLKPHIYLSDNDDCTKWGFHVAPIIIIIHDGIKDTMVIDPSTTDSAVSINSWALNIIQPLKGGTGFLIIKDPMYYTYPEDDNGRFEDELKIWTDSRNKELFDADYLKSITRIIKARYRILEVSKTKDFENKIRGMLK